MQDNSDIIININNENNSIASYNSDLESNSSHTSNSNKRHYESISLSCPNINPHEESKEFNHESKINTQSHNGNIQVALENSLLNEIKSHPEKKIKLDHNSTGNNLSVSNNIHSQNSNININTNNNNNNNNNNGIILIRFLIATRLSGSFIGKNGSIIKQMRELSNAHIDLDENNKDTQLAKRVLIVKGTLPQAITAARLIVEKLNEAENSANTHSSTTINNSTSNININNNNNNNNNPTITLLVCNASVGGIIGKGGMKIQETRSTTGCAVKVSEKVLDHSDEKTVSITGNKEQINKALAILIQQLGTAQLEHHAITKQPYQPKTDITNIIAPVINTSNPINNSSINPSNNNNLLTNSVTNQSALIASLNSGILTLQQQALYNPLLLIQLQQMQMQLLSLQQLQLPSISPSSVLPSTNPGTNSLANSSISTSLLPAISNISVSLPLHTTPTTLHSPNPINSITNNLNNSINSNMNTLNISISNSIAPILIGRGGSTISSIRTQSKAIVRISDANTNSNERIVTLTGTKEQVELASALVNQIINSNSHTGSSSIQLSNSNNHTPLQYNHFHQPISS